MALLDLQGMDNHLENHGHPSSHSTHSCHSGGGSSNCGGGGSGLSLLLC